MKKPAQKKPMPLKTDGKAQNPIPFHGWHLVLACEFYFGEMTMAGMAEDLYKTGANPESTDAGC